MTQKVYIVTRGVYSSYGIERVFLTKEEAEAYVAPFKRNLDRQRELGQYVYVEDDYPEIEEWEVGGAPPVERTVWVVIIERTGDVSWCQLSELEDSDPGKEHYWERDGKYQAHVEAQTKESAIKIAAERRTQFLANLHGVHA